MTKRRYALRDDQWERIRDLLPGRANTVGVTAKDNRLFIEAVLYRYRAGIAWRDLPERFGNFRAIHTRHTRWSAVSLKPARTWTLSSSMKCGITPKKTAKTLGMVCCASCLKTNRCL